MDAGHKAVEPQGLVRGKSDECNYMASFWWGEVEVMRRVNTLESGTPESPYHCNK